MADMADELLKLYAERQAAKGHSFNVDNEFQLEFEESFDYTETDDQLNAIADIKRDMESERPMDRLLCGDVGYGKTEVAMRAAFKAVQDGKQVAVLTPTTILAFQHFETFKKAFFAVPDQCRNDLSLSDCQGTEDHPGARRDGQGRHPGRHASAAFTGHQISRFGPSNC